MAQIKFKAKVQTVYNMDDSVAYTYVSIPTLTRGHCDMRAFRNHPKFGAYANSDLFMGMLRKIRSDVFNAGILKLPNTLEGVSVDTSDFLCVVTFDV